MVVKMFIYIRADATEVFVKYFFAHNKLNPACLTPVYLADMKTLAQSDPEIWEEFMKGNWVVNKNVVPFCAVGPDRALEQVNRMMKVAGGLIDTTLNLYARTNFFLAAPELARLAEEVKIMADLSTIKVKHHYEFIEAKVKQQEKNVVDLKHTTEQFMDGCDQLINMVTKAVLPETIQEDIAKKTMFGEEKLTAYLAHKVLEHAQTNEKNVVVAWRDQAEATHRQEGVRFRGRPVANGVQKWLRAT